MYISLFIIKFFENSSMKWGLRGEILFMVNFDPLEHRFQFRATMVKVSLAILYVIYTINQNVIDIVGCF